MADTKKQQDKAAETPEEDAAAQAGETERERVIAQLQGEADAEQKRVAEAHRAERLKAVQAVGAMAPTEKETSEGETQFSRDRLLQDASPLTGHPAHVVAGALYGNPNQYLTVEETQQAIEAWLATPVTAVEQ